MVSHATKLAVALLEATASDLAAAQPPLDDELLEKLSTIKGWLMIEPLPVTMAAAAYDKVREFRKDCADCPGPPDVVELSKSAALVVREVCVLQICCSAGSRRPMSDFDFESALETAFGRKLSPELRSQLHLTRSSICRLGRDRVLFERQGPKIYGPMVTHEELNSAWAAYVCVNLQNELFRTGWMPVAQLSGAGAGHVVASGMFRP